MAQAARRGRSATRSRPWADELVGLAPRRPWSSSESRCSATRDCAELIGGDTYCHETHYAGLVDDDGQGQLLRRPGARGRSGRRARSRSSTAADYLEHIAERVVPWSYLKLPYLKAKGWQGMRGRRRQRRLPRQLPGPAQRGRGHGHAAGPGGLRATLLRATSARKPVHHTLAFHWARLVELLYAAARRCTSWSRDPEITVTRGAGHPHGQARRRASAWWRRRAARSTTTT